MFEYFKIHGQDETFRKFRDFRNKTKFREIVKLYFPDEWNEYLIKEREEEKSIQDEFDRMKQELIEFGLERKWDVYSISTMRNMYNSFKKTKAKIDEKVIKYRKIFEEFKEIGMVAIQKKYGVKNISNFFKKYIPQEYKQYIKERYGRDVKVRENIYQGIFNTNKRCRKINSKTTEEYKKKQEEIHNERVRLFNIAKSLGSKIKYKERLALTTLQDIIDDLTNTRKRIEEYTKRLKEMYNEIHDNSYESMCEKFNYRGNRSELHKQMKKYLDGFSKIKLYENHGEYVRMKKILLDY